jgi:chemotaxis protein methyltransferase CheR
VNKVLRKRGVPSYTAYFDLIKNDKSGQELTDFVDIISTNVTHFFREEKHFDFLSNVWFPQFDFKHSKTVRIWCAAASTGEEPYSIAITLKELLEDKFPFDIYCSDISTRVLKTAQRGVYPMKAVENINRGILTKYFMEGKGNSQGFVKVKPLIARHVNFHQVNLIEPFRVPHHYDLVFCRNVMIYFDFKTKEDIVCRFYDVMTPNSFLFIGHSESLNGMNHSYTYVQPATYKKS